mgnify:CR=1 FL=1
MRVSPHFRVIFTSNPEEYCGVHATQDALMDRLITIHLPAPDELTQQQILVQKVGIDAPAALTIVRVAQGFLKHISTDASSSLRPCLMIASICQAHEITSSVDDPDFRDLCRDVLLSRAGQSIDEANEVLWTLFNQFDPAATPVTLNATPSEVSPASAVTPEVTVSTESNSRAVTTVSASAPKASAAKAPHPQVPLTVPETTIQSDVPGPLATAEDAEESSATPAPKSTPQAESANTPAAKILAFLQSVPQARLSEIEQQTGLNRVAVVNGLRIAIQQQHVEKQEVAGKPAMYRAKLLN